MQHSLRPAIRSVTHHEHARTRRQTLLHIVVEAHVGQLHSPRRRALDVPALDVAVTGSSLGSLGDTDVHGEGHIHPAVGELGEGILHGSHELGAGLDVVDDSVVVIQHGRGQPPWLGPVVVLVEAIRLCGGTVSGLGSHHPGGILAHHAHVEFALGQAEVHRVLLRESLVQRLLHLVARQLAGHVDLDSVGVLLEPSALVDDLLDGRPDEGDDGTQAGDAAWSVGHNRGEADESAVVDQTTLEHVPEGGGIDVTTAKQDGDVLALELGQLTGEARGDSRGACALLDELLSLNQAKERDRDVLLGHGDELIDPWSEHFERARSDGGHGEAVGERRRRRNLDNLSRCHCRCHGWASIGLDADDLNLRVDGLDRERDTCDKAAASHRHDDGVDVLSVLENLEADRAGARNDVEVVKAVDVLHAVPLDIGPGGHRGVRDGVALENDVGFERAALRDLGQGRDGGHEHGDGNTELAAVVRESERVVTGGGGDDALLLLLRFEREEGVARATFLEGTGGLFPLVLEVDFHARERAERSAVRAPGSHHARADAEVRGGDVLEGGELEAVYDLTRSDDALFFIGGVAPSRGARDDVLLGLLHGTAHHAPAVVVFDASGGRRSERRGGSGPRR